MVPKKAVQGATTWTGPCPGAETQHIGLIQLKEE